MSKEVLALIGLLLIMTVIVIASMPLLWILAQTPILSIRWLDQAAKALIYLGILYLYVRIFDYMYHNMYRKLSRCP